MSGKNIVPTKHTLESATRVAGELARKYGYDHYVTETYTAAGDAIAAKWLDGDCVTFGWADEPSLRRTILLHQMTGGDAALSILRVARPDGTVASVSDPGDPEARIAAFCHMSDDERAARWDELFGSDDDEGSVAR